MPVAGGGGCSWGLGRPQPRTSEKLCSGRNGSYERGQKFDVDLGYTQMGGLSTVQDPNTYGVKRGGWRGREGRVKRLWVVHAEARAAGNSTNNSHLIFPRSLPHSYTHSLSPSFMYRKGGIILYGDQFTGEIFRGTNHLAEVVRSKPRRPVYMGNIAPPFWAFLGLFTYPTPRD